MIQRRLIKLNLVTTPDNIKRNGYALLVCLDKDGRIGMGAKYRWYPKDIYRLPGGGMDKYEEPEHAAIRELKEELDITITPDKIIPLVHILIEATTVEGHFRQSFYCYVINVDPKQIIPGDDIDGLQFMTKEEYADLNRRLEETDFTPPPNSDWDIQKWKDYGILFSSIQKVVGEELTKNNLW